MATIPELPYLGLAGTEQLVATVKDLLNNKADKGDFATETYVQNYVATQLGDVETLLDSI